MSNDDMLGHTLRDAVKALRFQSFVNSLMFDFTEPGQPYANKAVQILIEWVRNQDRSLLTASGYVSVMEALRQAEVAYPLSETKAPEAQR